MDKATFRRRIYIEIMLKDILHHAKKGYMELAKERKDWLYGALHYMYITKEITKETKDRINHLATIILTTYKVFE